MIDSLGAGKKRLLETIHDSRDKLRELGQRWENRLTLEGLSPWKDYVDGRLALALDFDLGGATKHIHPPRPAHAEADGHKCIPILILSVEAWETRKGYRRNQQAVF